MPKPAACWQGKGPLPFKCRGVRVVTWQWEYGGLRQCENVRRNGGIGGVEGSGIGIGPCL